MGWMTIIRAATYNYGEKRTGLAQELMACFMMITILIIVQKLLNKLYKLNAIDKSHF
jgi:hypothetical protein